ncbi:MAG TPA: hypothetical protein PKJ72_11050, partial [Deltaproteobacteria bacterium]|nr:hypothetical protein [Deltaproteobacteria bacterium]
MLRGRLGSLRRGLLALHPRGSLGTALHRGLLGSGLLELGLLGRLLELLRSRGLLCRGLLPLLLRRLLGLLETLLR